jgi:hypothetical protein
MRPTLARRIAHFNKRFAGVRLAVRAADPPAGRRRRFDAAAHGGVAQAASVPARRLR